MERRVRYEFKSPFAFATGVNTAEVLIGVYVGLPQGDNMFHLYRVDEQGEPVGEVVAQMHSDIAAPYPLESEKDTGGCCQ
jgi:hypothetical protein